MHSTLEHIDVTLERAARLTDWQGTLTPTNIRQERERFFEALDAGRRYEPRFEYRGPDLTAARSAVDAVLDLDLSRVPAAVREEYEELRRHLTLELELLQAFAFGDDDRLSHASRAMYWPGDCRTLLADALQVIGPASPIRVHRHAAERVSPQDMAAAVRQAMATCGLSWTARVDAATAARVRVADHTREVLVSEDAEFTTEDVEKIIVHEVQTHVIRAENGQRLWQFGLFALGTAGSEILEEGMALLNEQTRRVARPDQMRVIAMHVVGIDIASRTGFHDTFRAVLPYFGEDHREAFGRVVRWKRGFRRQDRAMALWKDVVYFGGVHRVRAYLEAGGTMPALYLGRYDDRRTPQQIAELFQEFGRGPDVRPILPPFLT